MLFLDSGRDGNERNYCLFFFWKRVVELIMITDGNSGVRENERSRETECLCFCVGVASTKKKRQCEDMF